jgi:arginase family enzyme
MGHRHDNECARERRVYSTRWRVETRNQAEKIADKNVDEEGGKDREEAAAFFSCDVYHEFFHPADHNLEKVLTLGGNHAYSPGAKTHKPYEKEHDKPRIKDVGCVKLSIKIVTDKIKTQKANQLI